MSTLDEILSKLKEFEEDATKANKASEVRARRTSLELEVLFKKYRKETIERVKK